MSKPQHDDDVEFVPVPLDRPTRLRLVAMASEAGRPEIELAGDLLRDLLHDDAAAHGLCCGRGTHLN